VPVVENGTIKVGSRMKATISVDHRVSDGAEAARFMQKLAEFLENPVRMLV
jgi:pyruvate dehydrogenase E2 component (dihydrolipoamide acetyltransferase)